ncbi:MAG: prepilin-type N-terminal cleavage/methylation domain-containing protein [Pirellulales bacterium]
MRYLPFGYAGKLKAMLPRRPPAAFTLVELLAAIAIIGVMVGLIVPAVQQTRAAARQAACQSNLRKWVLACHCFAETHRGYLPRRGQGPAQNPRLDRPEDWFNALPPLIEIEPYSSLHAAARHPQASDNCPWICPEAQPLATAKANDVYFTYAMNMGLSVWSAPRPDHIDRVGSLQTMVFMADSLGPYCSVFPSRNDYRPIDRHAGSVNIAFLDGHVASVASEDAGSQGRTLDHPDIRWFPPNGNWPGPPE